MSKLRVHSSNRLKIFFIVTPSPPPPPPTHTHTQMVYRTDFINTPGPHYNKVNNFLLYLPSKKSVSMSFFTTNNFLEKYTINFKSSSTSMKFNYKIGCKLFNVVCTMIPRVLQCFHFSSAVLLLHNRTQSICTMPVTFFK